MFGETRYAAGSWKGRQRRVLIKAEIVRQEGRQPSARALRIYDDATQLATGLSVATKAAGGCLG